MLQIPLPPEEERRWSAGSPGIELIPLKQMRQNCILEMTAVDSQTNIHTFCTIDGLSRWQPFLTPLAVLFPMLRIFLPCGS